MKTNVAAKRPAIHTHEGGVAHHVNAEQQLRRSVMACLLFEDEFYEDGVSIATRIHEAVAKVPASKVQAIAIEAREKMKLRHVPLWIVRQMATLPHHKGLVADTLERVIQRADELAEFCALWKKGDTRPLSKTLSAQAKRGLARAFVKFDEYALAKYNRDGAVKLRDVLFLCHAKAKDEAQAEVWKRLIDGKLATPDTWEVALSGGANKKETFERLMMEKKLFALAYIKNLRNMFEAGVDKGMVAAYGKLLDLGRVLPFRFITAARFVPQWEDILEPLMFRCLESQQKLKGKTALVMDVSSSMGATLSGKGETSRMDAGFGLGVLLREICEPTPWIYTFSDNLVQVAPRRGFALRDAMKTSQSHNGTYLAKALAELFAKDNAFERVIVITDEQSHDSIIPPPAGCRGYVINVASAQNGVGYGPWMHVDGFSEAILDYIMASEAQSAE